MAAKADKPTSKADSEKFPRKAVQVQLGKTETETGPQHGRLSDLAGACGVSSYQRHRRQERLGRVMDTPRLMAELRGQAAQVNGGNLTRAEAMLMNQATALQSLFSRLAERGMGCDSAVPFETKMRMALRAQSQCRATLETLAAIKNPPVVFARQANIANRPQQVNNGTPEPSRARENEVPQTQPSEGGNELLPDVGTSGLAGRADPEMEAVGAVHGATNARGEGEG